MLWVCRIRQDIPALIGSQKSLLKAAPWPCYEFPWRLPNEFESYAQKILNEVGSVALLDHRDAAHFNEILITSPEHVIDVVEIIKLPQGPEEARAIGRDLNEKYAGNR